MNIEIDDAWGLPLDLEDLAAATEYAKAAGLPLQIAEDHEGACEVLHIGGRYSAYSEPWQFMVWRPVDRANLFAVSEGLVDGVERRAHFGNILAAIRFCEAQRGADWPMDDTANS